MNETLAMREQLIHELNVGARTTKGLFGKIKEMDWDYRPQESMRSLLEISNHLAQVPFIDLAILQESSQEQVRQLEGELHASHADELGGILERGVQAYSDYMVSLSVDDFLHKISKPFYMELGSSQAKWCTETLTHFFHHRAQLFTYLKMLAYPVNMFDLY